ncbi:MAG: trimeric intracellular cation channel family protein [Acutalibacteraceae bacterium]|nr:trimeric intracellular cation channel family protein [Acutalibacteraceae bacterium]
MSVEEIILFVFEMVGTVAFAISGAMIAIKKRVDIFGVIVLSSMTALGGGIVRDILIGHLPPTMFSDYRYVLAAVVTSVVVFVVAYIFRDLYRRSESTVDAVNNIFDALGLGIFTVMGAKVAIESGFTVNGILVVCLAVITGVGGGIIRDIMLKEIPFVLKKRIYAVASILGGTAYHLMYVNNVNIRIATVVAVLIVFTVRILATMFKLDLPKIKYPQEN